MIQKSKQDALKAGDQVTFDNDKIEIFKAETSSLDKAVQKYKELVLAGMDHVGIVRDIGANLTIVSFRDGWELPIPTKYLIVLPRN